MVFSCKYFLLLAVVFSCARAATKVIECYHCSSARNGSCGDAFEADKNPKIPCHNGYCNVRTLKSSAADLTIRGCASESNICNNPEFEKCLTCSEDLCNQSPNTLLNYKITIFVCSIAIMKYFF